MFSSPRHESRHPFLPPLIIAVVALAAIAGSFLLDTPVKHLVLDSHSGHWSRSPIAGRLSEYGDWPELMLLGVIGTLIARWFRNVRWQRILIAAMIASTLAGMTVNLSRLTTGRTRPRAAVEMGWYGPRHAEKWLIGEADFNSFPSGHTATAVGFAGVILFAAPGWGLLALVAASSVALSRILLGAHHPSDVVTAATMALVIAWLVWEFLGRRGRVDCIVRPPLNNRLKEPLIKSH
jgi:membrane-associated phospholipid phosphatase